MMKSILITTISILLMSAAQATPIAERPNHIVFMYECKHVDPTQTGFGCHATKQGIEFYWVKNLADMSADKKEYARYEFNRIALRFLSMGGKRFFIHEFGASKNKSRVCGPAVEDIDGRRYHVNYSFTCTK